LQFGRQICFLSAPRIRMLVMASTSQPVLVRGRGGGGKIPLAKGPVKRTVRNVKNI